MFGFLKKKRKNHQARLELPPSATIILETDGYTVNRIFVSAPDEASTLAKAADGSGRFMDILRKSPAGPLTDLVLPNVVLCEACVEGEAEGSKRLVMTYFTCKEKE
jgi:hypothetical protein